MNRHEITDQVETQAQEIAASLVTSVTVPGKPDLKDEDLRNYLADKQIIALIAYVQKLGAYREVHKDHPGGPLLDPDSNRRVEA